MKYFFVFDVESVGLHGKGFAVGGVVIDRSGKELRSVEFHCDPEFARSGTLLDDDDLQWVVGNVKLGGEWLISPEDVRQAFWEEWQKVQEDFPGIVMVAECAWPVEARFLAACVNDDKEDRKWKGPYPLHDVASVMLAKGMDPMASYERLPNELPAHNALADARQSARLLIEALNRTDAPAH